MATNTQSETNGRRDEPISGLLRSLFADVSLILRREAELAKIELREKASKAGVGVGLLAAAAAFALYALGVMIAAAVLALALVLPAWVAALIVSAVLLAVAVGLMLAGRSKLREGAPYAPTRTLETVEEDIGWMRRETDQLKALE
jgi:Flp pilus assembly protein TadB